MLCFFLVSCINKPLKEKSISIHSVGDNLISEAIKLMRSDSSFWMKGINYKYPKVCVYDTLIREKLDSAISISTYKNRAYLSKYVYLMHCGKLNEVLQLFNVMEANKELMNADMLHLKAMLEDKMENKNIAQKYFHKADSAYDVKIRKYEYTDSLQYQGYRIMKALNLSLMTDSFDILRMELLYYKLVHQKSLGIPYELEKIKSRKQYYRYLFEGDTTFKK